MPSTSEPTTDAWTPAPGSPQARALAHVTDLSEGRPVDPSLRVTLHFHPDRFRGDIAILTALAADGIYRSQFETGISSGWFDPATGGSRWRWESHIFAGAYDDAPSTERPKYGALNYRRRPTGGATRFGSAHLRVRAAVLPRYVEVWARRLPCAIEWHPGFLLSVDTLRQHPSFRGPEYVALGMTIARDGCLTPRILGDAARTGKYEVQDLKKVWHYLARFGDRSPPPMR